MNAITEERIIAGLTGQGDLFDPNSHLIAAIHDGLEFKHPVLAEFAQAYRAAIDNEFRQIGKPDIGAKYPDIEELWDKIEAGELSQEITK